MQRRCFGRIHWIARSSTGTIRRFSCEGCWQPGEHCSQGALGGAVDRRAQGTRRRRQCRAVQSRDHLYGLFRRQDDRPDSPEYDVLPRVLSAEEWRHLETGIVQRITALNLLLHGIYHDQLVLGDGIVPTDLILGNHNYRPLMRGIDVPHKAYVNICGTDIVRDERGGFLVLVNNARIPSGVSYVVENRHMMLRAFPDLLDDISLRPINNYIERADQTTRLLDIKYRLPLPDVADVGSPTDVSQWNALLRSAAGYHADRRLHAASTTPARVAGFLLLNQAFPRSVHHCVREVGRLLGDV